MRLHHLVSALLLTACTPRPDPSIPAEPTRASIEVLVAAPQSLTYQRALAAFTAETLQIARSEAAGGLVVSVPLIPNPSASFPSSYEFRALVLPDSAGSRVSLAATATALKTGTNTSTALTSVCKRYPKHECGIAWAKLERLAKAIAR